MDEVQKRASNMVEIINLQQEEVQSNAEQVRRMGHLMKKILDMAELDLEIDMMDVSQDDQLARQLQEQLYLYEHMEIAPMAPPVVQEVVLHQDLPICSITRRIGLTVKELKDIAKQHRLSTQGAKEDLCRRLVEAGLVRLV